MAIELLLFCERCGCPHTIHDAETGECLHCAAFPERGQECVGFIREERRQIITINKDFVMVLLFSSWLLGILVGAGILLSLSVISAIQGIILFGVGIITTGLLLGGILDT